MRGFLHRAAPFITLLLGVAAILAIAYTGAAYAKERCGEASWYGHAHHGKLQANGRPFDMHAYTAAMWDVPFGSRWIVRNVQNGRSVQIVVTDRGPAKRLNRVIDLSYAAAKGLGMIEAGVGEVCLERLSTGGA